jgi:hypothetical protein
MTQTQPVEEIWREYGWTVFAPIAITVVDFSMIVCGWTPWLTRAITLLYFLVAIAAIIPALGGIVFQPNHRIIAHCARLARKSICIVVFLTVYFYGGVALSDLRSHWDLNQANRIRDAIGKYVQYEGHPPQSLGLLVPGYLDSVSGFGPLSLRKVSYATAWTPAYPRRAQWYLDPYWKKPEPTVYDIPRTEPPTLNVDFDATQTIRSAAVADLDESTLPLEYDRATWQHSPAYRDSMTLQLVQSRALIGQPLAKAIQLFGSPKPTYWELSVETTDSYRLKLTSDATTDWRTADPSTYD